MVKPRAGISRQSFQGSCSSKMNFSSKILFATGSLHYRSTESL